MPKKNPLRAADEAWHALEQLPIPSCSIDDAAVVVPKSGIRAITSRAADEAWHALMQLPIPSYSLDDTAEVDVVIHKSGIRTITFMEERQPKFRVFMDTAATISYLISMVEILVGKETAEKLADSLIPPVVEAGDLRPLELYILSGRQPTPRLRQLILSSLHRKPQGPPHRPPKAKTYLEYVSIVHWIREAIKAGIPPKTAKDLVGRAFGVGESTVKTAFRECRKPIDGVARRVALRDLEPTLLASFDTRWPRDK
jgi:hypothetical protein